MLFPLLATELAPQTLALVINDVCAETDCADPRIIGFLCELRLSGASVFLPNEKDLDELERAVLTAQRAKEAA